MVYNNYRQYFKEKLLLWRKELLGKSEIFVDFITRERLGQMLQEIELALDRIVAGEYGYCEINDEEIGL